MTATIVVGMTAAPAARRAVEWAVHRAAQRRQPIELVGVVGGAVGAVGERDVIASVLEATEVMLHAEAARARELAPTAGVVLTTRAVVGNPVAKLAEASKDAALLVIGSDYRGPGSGPARGIHGIRIVAASSCPVVVVPDVDTSDRRGVVVGVDGSPVSEAAIEFAAAEADRLGEPLIAVCAWTPLVAPRNRSMLYPEQYLASMALAAGENLSLSLAGLRSRYPGLEIDERVVEGFPSAVITSLAAHARLAVVGTHGRGAMARFLLGSISHEVLQRLATVTVVAR